MTQAQYDDAIGNLVAYLEWMGEPAKQSRVNLGIAVMLFLGVFTFFAYKLSGAYWKDVK
jgi:ubiquinol-cytochrome c reductase cytochrome c1 subunit